MMTDIENLYECYAGDVRRFALYLCSDVAMADEIISDTFMCAWMAADRIRPSHFQAAPFSTRVPQMGQGSSAAWLAVAMMPGLNSLR